MRPVICFLLAALAVFASACRESGTIQVKSLNFKGVKAVDVSALRGALATKTRSTRFTAIAATRTRASRTSTLSSTQSRTPST
jgi:hypothetical protein